MLIKLLFPLSALLSTSCYALSTGFYPVDETASDAVAVPIRGGQGTMKVLPKGISSETIDFARIYTCEGNPCVLVTFSSEGREQFRQLTEKNVGKKIAVVVNDQIFSAPLVREAVPTGTMEIRGNFSPEDARLLRAALAPKRGNEALANELAELLPSKPLFDRLRKNINNVPDGYKAELEKNLASVSPSSLDAEAESLYSEQLSKHQLQLLVDLLRDPDGKEAFKNLSAVQIFLQARIWPPLKNYYEELGREPKGRAKESDNTP